MTEDQRVALLAVRQHAAECRGVSQCCTVGPWHLTLDRAAEGDGWALGARLGQCLSLRGMVDRTPTDDDLIALNEVLEVLRVPDDVDVMGDNFPRTYSWREP